jgi:hypothetical protein
MNVNSDSNGRYGTGFVAKYILRIPESKIYRLIYAGKVSKPALVWGRAFCWTIQEIEPLAAVLNKQAELEAFTRLPVGTIDQNKIDELKSVTIEEAMRNA